MANKKRELSFPFKYLLKDISKWYYQEEVMDYLD